MAVTVYRYDDASAPDLTGAAGSFIALLDACLVNGYGSKGAAGWSKPYTGTNLAAFRAGGGNRRYLRVDDTTTTAAALRGYGAMTDVNTGTDPFPTVAQMAGGVYIYKSAAGSTPRPWVVVADNTCFYFACASAQTEAAGFVSDTSQSGMFFGDFFSDVPSDTWNTALIAGNSNAASSGRLGELAASSAASNAGHFVARDYTQTGSSVAVGKVASCRTAAITMGLSGGAFPSPVHGGVDLSLVLICEPTTQVTRGRLPGLWNPEHALMNTPGDTFTGKTGTPMAGKSFILLPVVGNSAAGRMVIETSNTWS